jgi:Ca-activated chloride channel family protein
MRRAYPAALLGVALLLSTAACDDPKPTSEPPPGGPGILRVLAGSELADIEPLLGDVRKATGVTVTMRYTGTLDGVEQVNSGEAARASDAIWFSSNRYLELHDGATGRIGTATKVMSSPVVLGVRPAVASALGWDSRRPTWKEIADAGTAGRFSYGMASPSASNSGFSALVALTAGLSGAGTALTEEQVRQVGPQLTAFFKAQALTAGSSGWLADAFRRRNDVTALINYESVLMSLRASGVELTIVHPSDGVVTADYPLTLLGGGTAAARQSYQKVVDYLRRDDVQRRLATQTYRRPVRAQAAEAGAFPGPLVELPFPVKLETADALIAAYQNTFRKAPTTLYVLDLSGSMKGDRLDNLKAALLALTGRDTSLSGRFSRFAGREHVTFVPFSSRPAAPQRYEVPAGDAQPELDRIAAAVSAMTANGDTAIYDALAAAYQEAARQIDADPDRFTTIVLLTDGERTAGRDLAGFRSFHSRLSGAARAVPVFPVLFGESAVEEMDEVAVLTGGRTFDARRDPLAAVFKEIRGYQ